MNGLTDMQSFEAARRRQLIEATIDTVADLGFRSASLNEIARRANVSQGLFAHYFGDKDGLLEATLRHLAARLPRATAARMRASSTPLERLYSVTDTALADEEFDRRTSAVWLAFWGQIVHSEPYRRVQLIYQRRMNSNLRHGLRGLVAPERVETSAALIGAAVDGLWLQSHATEGGRALAADARRTVRELISLLIGGATSLRPAGKAAEPCAARSPAEAGAVARAGAASEAWRAIDGYARADILRATARAIHAERKALARLEARDAGQPVSDFEAHVAPRAVRAFERAAEAALLPVERRCRLEGDVYAYAERVSAGPAILRMGAGLALSEHVRAAASALAGGRGAVLMSESPKARALVRIVELAEECGAPGGVLSIVGGTPADERRRAKSVAVVLKDADPRDAAAKLTRGARGWARSRHASETLIFVHEDRRKEFLARLRIEAGGLSIGDPLDPQTEIGPLASRADLDRALERIEDARIAGATLLLGGRPFETESRTRGAFLRATILDGCRAEMAIASKPLNAPVFLISPFARVEDAAGQAAWDDGRSLVVFGQDVGPALDFARLAKAATCHVETPGDALPSSSQAWLDDMAPVVQLDAPREMRLVARCDARHGVR